MIDLYLTVLVFVFVNYSQSRNILTQAQALRFTDSGNLNISSKYSRALEPQDLREKSLLLDFLSCTGPGFCYLPISLALKVYQDKDSNFYQTANPLKAEQLPHWDSHFSFTLRLVILYYLFMSFYALRIYFKSKDFSYFHRET